MLLTEDFSGLIVKFRFTILVAEESPSLKFLFKSRELFPEMLTVVQQRLFSFLVAFAEFMLFISRPAALNTHYILVLVFHYVSVKFS